MSIASNLQALAGNLSSILSAINTKLTAKGSTAADTLSEVAGKINAIPTGGVTPTGTKNITENGTYDVTAYASAAVAVPEPSGTKTITTNGTHDVAAYASATVNVPTENPPSGTVNITANGTVDVTNYASAEVAVPTGTARSSSDLTASGATVTVPAGLYSSQATKSVATATQATPSISVNTSTGVITASATQSAGYVSAGTKSATQSLTTKAAATIYPTSVDKTIAAGTFLTGKQTIPGDTNFKSSNIKSGVTLWGLTGNYEGSGVNDLTASNGLTATRTGGGLLQFSLPKAGTLAGVYLEKDYMEGAQTGTVNSLLILGTDSSPVVLLTYVGSSGIFVGLSSAAGSFEQSGTSYGSTVSVYVSTNGGTGFGSGTYHVMPIWQ